MDDDSQDYVIKTDGGDFRIKADKGMPQDQVLSLAAATNPKFAQYHAQAQAQSQLQTLPQPPAPKDAFPQGAAGFDPQKAVNALPMIGGAVGGAVGNIPGAALGGAIGEAAKRGIEPLAGIPRSDTPVKDIAVSGAVQGAFEGAGQVVSKVAAAAAPALIKNLIKPAEKMFGFGKDPVEAVMNLPGTALSKEDLLKNVVTELDKTGRDISAKVANAQATLPVGRGIVPIQRLVNDPIDKQIAEITANRGMTMSEKKGVMDALEDFRDGLMKDVKGTSKRSMLNLSEMQQMKQEIGKATNWSKPTDAVQAKVQPIINALRKEIYDGFKTSIEARVPGIREDNLKWGSLLDAQKSIEKRMNTGPVMSLKDVVIAAHSPGLGLAKVAANTTPGAVTAAKALKAVGTKAGGAGVSNLLRTIAEMLETSGGTGGSGATAP